MSIIIKTDRELELLRVAGKRLAHVIDETSKMIQPGITTAKLDQHAEQMVLDYGDTPAFKGYQPEGADYPFPAMLCISINEEIVHGIPGERVLKEGDIVTIDGGIKHEGVFVDHAVTIPVGFVDQNVKTLLSKTKHAMMQGIDQARPGNRIGDISHAIETAAQNKYGIVRVLAGHGVGRYIHEDPFVPNFGSKDTGPLLEAGMVIAIEPMFTLGAHKVNWEADGYTVSTKDGSLSAHFEHTVAITKNGPEILTKI